MDKLIIIGAGGHGRVVADVVRRDGLYKEIAFLDDAIPAVGFGYPYLGKVAEFEKYANDYDVFVAIGNNQIRRKITETVKGQGGRVVTVIASEAIVGSGVTIGVGSVILPRAVVNAGTCIGNSVIINTASVLDHDCVVGDFSHIAVGASLSGSVHIGENTWIDAGAVVKTNVRICDGCKVDVGSAVNCNLEEPGNYTGVPARKND